MTTSWSESTESSRRFEWTGVAPWHDVMLQGHCGSEAECLAGQASGTYRDTSRISNRAHLGRYRRPGTIVVLRGGVLLMSEVTPKIHEERPHERPCPREEARTQRWRFTLEFSVRFSPSIVDWAGNTPKQKSLLPCTHARKSQEGTQAGEGDLVRVLPTRPATMHVQGYLAHEKLPPSLGPP